MSSVYFTFMKCAPLWPYTLFKCKYLHCIILWCRKFLGDHTKPIWKLKRTFNTNLLSEVALRNAVFSIRIQFLILNKKIEARKLWGRNTCGRRGSLVQNFGTLQLCFSTTAQYNFRSDYMFHTMNTLPKLFLSH